MNNKIFSGFRSCQLVKNNRCFRDSIFSPDVGYSGPWNVGSF